MSLPYKSVYLAALMFMWSTSAMAAGDAARGRQLAETCMGCHAVEGYYNVYPSYRVPKLGGQGAKYIESALKAYQAGERQHSTMQANAYDLDAQEMADIASFFESHGQ